MSEERGAAETQRKGRASFGKTAARRLRGPRRQEPTALGPAVNHDLVLHASLLSKIHSFSTQSLLSTAVSHVCPLAGQQGVEMSSPPRSVPLGGTSPDRGWDTVAGGRSGPPVCGQPWFTEDSGAQGSRLHFAQGQVEAVDQSAFLTLEGRFSWYTHVQVRGGRGFRNKTLRGGASSLTEVREARPRVPHLTAPQRGSAQGLVRTRQKGGSLGGTHACPATCPSWEHVVRAAWGGALCSAGSGDAA